MEHLGQSVPATLSTESLGEWAGQPSSTARKAPHFTITSRSVDQTKTSAAVTTTTISSTDVSPETSKSTHLSTTPPANSSSSTTSTSTLQPPHPSRGLTRSSSRSKSERHQSPPPTPGVVHAAHVASMHPAHSQAQAQIPETARMTKARRAPCCQWKHEDRKHHLHMAWMHHYTPS